MKPINLLPFLSLLLLLAPSSGNAAGSMLRITCDGSNKGAEVEVNGKFKGQCPLDLQVPEGMVNLKVRQVIDDLEERVYEEKMRIGDGVVKKVDVVLTSKLSAKGKQYYDRFLASKLQRANSGDVKAMFEMASHYRGERNEEKLVLWLRKAADAGHPTAMRELSFMYAKGESGLPKSDDQSKAWLLRAVEGGNALAIRMLAFDYQYGQGGFEENAVQANYWKRKAAEAYLKEAQAGDPAAMQDVGENYLSGYGIAADPEAGRKWLQRAATTYRKLADAGDYNAMRNLSYVTIDENGEKMSEEQAQYWKKLAEARNGEFQSFKELRAYVQHTEGASK